MKGIDERGMTNEEQDRFHLLFFVSRSLFIISSHSSLAVRGCAGLGGQAS